MDLPPLGGPPGPRALLCVRPARESRDPVDYQWHRPPLVSPRSAAQRARFARRRVPGRRLTATHETATAAGGRVQRHVEPRPPSDETGRWEGEEEPSRLL